MTFLDLFDNELNVDDKVIYTTNGRGSGLQYAKIIELYNDKVKLRHINQDGTDMYERRYIGGYDHGNERNWELTNRLVRPSIIDYSKHKIVLFD